MEPIYNKNGYLAGWLSDDEDVIFDNSMHPCAFIYEEGIFSYGGVHLGFFREGVFRDRRSGAVGFLKDAKPGRESTILPTLNTPPIPNRPPSTGIPPTPPSQPVPDGTWSSKSWESFLENE